MVKSLPAMQETQVQSLGGEDPLEGGTATHSSILAWRISWTEETVIGQARGEGPALCDQLTTGRTWSLTSLGSLLKQKERPSCFSGSKVVSPPRGWIRLLGLL